MEGSGHAVMTSSYGNILHFVNDTRAERCSLMEYTHFQKKCSFAFCTHRWTWRSGTARTTCMERPPTAGYHTAQYQRHIFLLNIQHVEYLISFTNKNYKPQLTFYILLFQKRFKFNTGLFISHVYPFLSSFYLFRPFISFPLKHAVTEEQ
jgi:hypothetical protein